MAGLAAGNGRMLGRIRVYLLLLLATAVLIGGGLGASYYLSLPAIGFSFGYGDRVAGVDAGGPAEQVGLAVGDRVITINGLSPLAGQIYVRPGQQVVPLTIQRNDRTLDLEISPASLSLEDVLGRIGYCLTALAFWTMAILVLTFKAHDTTAQMLVLTLLLATLGFVVLLLADMGLGWASVLMSTLVLILGPLYVHYHTVFPWPSEMRARKTMLILLYALSAGLWLAVLVSRAYRPEWSTLALSVAKAYFGLCLLLGWGLLVRAYRHTASLEHRRQIGVVMLGLAMALLPLILLVLLPQILPGFRYLTIWPAFLLLAIIPASYLYAIFRHNLMRFDWVVSQRVARFFLFFSLFVLYLAVLWLMQTLAPLAPEALQEPPAVAVVTSIGLILILLRTYEPLKDWIEKTVYRLLYGSWYDYKSFISRMTRAFSQALDEHAIANLLVREVAGTMRLNAIALLLAGQDQKDAFRVGAEAGFDLPGHPCLDESLTEVLRQAQGMVDHGVLCAQVQPEASTVENLVVLGDAGGQVWVPLLQQEKLVGILLVGEKTAGDCLTEEDRDILNTLAHHVTSAVARAWATQTSVSMLN